MLQFEALKYLAPGTKLNAQIHHYVSSCRGGRSKLSNMGMLGYIAYSCASAVGIDQDFYAE